MQSECAIRNYTQANDGWCPQKRGCCEASRMYMQRNTWMDDVGEIYERLQNVWA